MEWVKAKKGWLNEYASGAKAKKQKGKSKKEKDTQQEDAQYGVVFVPVRCPKCRSKKVRCYSSSPPVRYHICKKCGMRFKSYEREL